MPAAVTVKVEEGWKVSGQDAVLAIPQGGTFDQVVFRWATKDENGVKTYVNLSGMTGRTVFRTHPEAEDVLLNLTTENGGMSLDASGNISFHITATQSAALPSGINCYETELYSGAIVYKFAKGQSVNGRELVR